MTDYIKSAAEFSTDRVYRYTLERWWSPFAQGRAANFIMLNPSTADESKSDPTVTRAIGFARSWGYDGLIVTNIFAYRSTDPLKLYSELSGTMCGTGRMNPDHIIGPENDTVIQEIAKETAMIIAAWGTHGGLLHRDQQVIKILRANSIPLYCLGVTKDGFPRHPLFVNADTKPERFV